MAATRQKMSPVFKRRALVHQPDVGFVHQGRGLQRVLATLAAEVGAGQAMQLVIDQGEKLVDGVLIAAPEFTQQAGDFARVAH